MSDSVKTVLSCLFTALSVGRIFGIPRRVILCMSLGLGMIGYAIALLANDSSGTINAFLDTLNGSIYDGAVVTLFVCGILLIIIGTSLYIACQKPEESSEIVKTNCPSIETFDKVLGLPLELYIGIMLVILCLVSLVASVYGGIFFSMVENQLGNRMISQVKNDYYNETSTDQFSVAWNRMQEKFGCCGAVDYRDYRNSTYHRTIGQLVPFTCCMNGNGIGVAACRDEAMIPINPRCNGQSPTVGNWKQLNPCGCHAHVSPILKGSGMTFLVISLLGCLLSVVLLTWGSHVVFRREVNSPAGGRAEVDRMTPSAPAPTPMPQYYAHYAHYDGFAEAVAHAHGDGGAAAGAAVAAGDAAVAAAAGAALVAAALSDL